MIKNSGFTLVEIALVMVIIGLLIGGIFGGMVLIENMKVNATMQQIKKFEAAALNFKQAYNYYPGDLGNPTVLLSDCTSPCDLAGNQDGKITGNGWNAWNSLMGWNHEEAVFWHHLAAANMVEGIISSGGAGITVGTHIPISPFETSYALAYNGIGATGTKGSTIVIRNNPYQTAPGGVTTDDLVFKGSESSKLDAKMDDGNPSTGRYLSWDSAGPGTPPASYNLNATYGARYIYNF